MASVSSSPIRRTPQQGRSERRLASFLDVAAELIVEVGFDAVTMTAIAERAGTSIGALYHYFPDKDSIASALHNQYAQGLEAQWARVTSQAAALTHAEFVDLLVESAIDFIERRPAYLQLIAARYRFVRDPAGRKSLRALLAGAFQAKNSSLSDVRALRAANVTVEIIKGMKNLYPGSQPEEWPILAAEFKQILTFYLGNVLAEAEG